MTSHKEVIIEVGMLKLLLCEWRLAKGYFLSAAAYGLCLVEHGNAGASAEA